MPHYTTSQIAQAACIHPNTVRFYEEVGFITKPARRPNGYRVYTELHIRQVALIRIAMRAEVLQCGLRKKAVEIVQLCALPDMDAAIAAAKEYALIIEAERARAKSAIRTVEAQLESGGVSDAPPVSLTRREAAIKLGITTDTLRNWELNGLIEVGRMANGYRRYDRAAMERLNIIRTLRCANYSLSAILRLMNKLSNADTVEVANALNTPEADEDVLSACDRLLYALSLARRDAKLILRTLKDMKKDFSTLQ
ncbi:MAG: MerR family transcriptional regulator [Clostridia bacterium]|nr:MerR family transcriptional regulator [Clostridia bacterium]